MTKKTRFLGFTLVELLVVVLIIALLIAILLPALAKAREAAMRMECSSRMRQVGLAMFQYEKQYQALPNAQWNAFREMGGFMGMSMKPGAVSVSSKMTEVLRCPSDSFLIQSELWNGLSYAPVVDSGYLDDCLQSGALSGEVHGNIVNCAWSYCRQGYAGGSAETRAAWQLRNLTDVAPDTFLLVEFWGPGQRVMLNTETPAGYLLFPYSTNGDRWGYQQRVLPRMGSIGWTGKRCAKTVTAVSDGGAIGAGGGMPGPGATILYDNVNVGGVGGYIFLGGFGQLASVAQNRGISSYPGAATFVHSGFMNLLVADGSVQAKWILNVTDREPWKVSQWTRGAD